MCLCLDKDGGRLSDNLQELIIQRQSINPAAMSFIVTAPYQYVRFFLLIEFYLNGSFSLVWDRCHSYRADLSIDIKPQVCHN